MLWISIKHDQIYFLIPTHAKLLFLFRTTYEKAVSEREAEIEGTSQKLNKLKEARYIIVNIIMFASCKWQNGIEFPVIFNLHPFNS